MYKKGMVLVIICLFIGASVASSANSATSTVNSENIFHSTVFKGNNDGCYNRTEVWKDFPYKDNDHFSHNGDGWYDKENDTLHLIDGEDIEHFNDAIDLVCEHGTVYIHSGDYWTGRIAIRLDKSLNFTGEDKNTTTISGYVTSDGIIISSWYVNITGFTIRDAGKSSLQAGIKITIPQANKTTNNIYNNFIRNNSNGLYVATVYGAPGSKTSVNIFKNKIFNNTYDGVVLRHANNTVHDNEIFNNGRNGIGLWNSPYNTIDNNTIRGNGVDGIWNDGGGNNTIMRNTIKDNTRNGITFSIDFDSTPFEYTCEDNVIYENTIESNEKGGISLYHSNNNIFWNNTIEDNKEFGFKILQILKGKDYTNAPSSNDNEIYHNNFINN
ncbi:MAG: right-handed parallel beta-helix repeat-containing protein, partial [Thermoplasmatales archaeon]|nr:right-handed parallel beta-helix repeat-containing protein [Thermoplasmatales archaeon]